MARLDPQRIPQEPHGISQLHGIPQPHGISNSQAHVATLDTFIERAIAIVREVTPYVLETFSSQTFIVSNKSDTSPVTDVDIMIERRVADTLANLLPGAAMVGEETLTEQVKTHNGAALEYYRSVFESPYTVVVDPIDGTRNFINGKNEFCIAIALMANNGTIGWPCASVIAVPTRGVLYRSGLDGAFVEDIKTGVVTSLPTPTCSSRSVASGSPTTKRRMQTAGMMPVISCATSGSSVYDMLETCLGGQEASFVASQRLWDIAAPLALAEALGLELRRLSTGKRITAFGPSEFSPEVVERPWGLVDSFVLTRPTQDLAALVVPRP
jgi:fructose-1,6-bisphosphatase/inositol monophosphatase family enzyme